MSIDPLEDTEDLVDEILSVFDGDDDRLLRASNQFDLKVPHVVINGQVSFLNSYGYL